jgi:UDP-hydrolysing UDP-N-acetyl-D-glucosamine 2-epimerase
MKKRKKRKVCVAIFSRANYGSIRKVLEKLKTNSKIELQILVGGSANIEKYGSVSKLIKKDKFFIDEEIYFLVEGETPTTMVKTTALGMIEIATAFQRLKPDIVLTVGDRYETLSTVVSAAYMNIPVAHTMGGEVTGTIDESIRHAITKFSHIHFPANEKAKNNIIKMGENKKHVFNVGCPRIDLVKSCLKNKPRDINELVFGREEGVGEKFNLNGDFLTLMHYPVTTEYGKNYKHMCQILDAIRKINIPKLIFWPNADAGSEEISAAIREYREKKYIQKAWFVKNLDHETFFHVLKMTKCLIGNTSAAIREGSFIGVPTVSIGTRQNGRERGKNVIDARYNTEEIHKKILFQMKNKKKLAKSSLYGNGNAASKIVRILETIQVNVQKKLTYK